MISTWEANDQQWRAPAVIHQRATTAIGATMAQRILIVDDDSDIIRVVRGYLEQAGYQTLTASDGVAALRLVRQERPDVVVLDLMLPGRSGWDVLQAIREDPLLAATPIVLLTARVEDIDKVG